MNEKITQAIQSHVEKNRLVFWYDDDGKHREIFEGISVSGRKLTIENNEWWIKYHVLQEEPKTHFLIYAPYAKPEDDRNWLLDLNLGHFVFAGDLTETFRNELGLPDTFRRFISDRLPFFQNNRERMAPLLELVEPQRETESSLALKMMGIILSGSAAERLSHWSFGRVLFSLIADAIRGEGEAWQQVTKYNLHPWFREQLKPYLLEVPDDMEPAGAAISIYRIAASRMTLFEREKSTVYWVYRYLEEHIEFTRPAVLRHCRRGLKNCISMNICSGSRRNGIPRLMQL